MAAPNDSASILTKSQLPHYRRPPVVEVAISVQYDELASLQPVHIGLLWDRLKDRYPKTEYHPPIASVVELFGEQREQAGTLSIDTSIPLGRTWFVSDDKLKLIQIQPDRFVLNWRKLATDEEYPSYETLRAEFERELSMFVDFIHETRLGPFKPLQCELTYVNHLPQGKGWQNRSDVGEVLALWSGQTSEDYLPPLEGVRLLWHYRFEDQGAPLGRMHVQLSSATRARDNLPIFALNLIARGAPHGAGLTGVLSFTDTAHEWIVRGFTAVTTPRMHELWEREI